MFRMLFRRAQATVDRAIDGLMLRVIVAIPFLIAAGFGTAALAIWLNREYGPETGSLILAASRHSASSSRSLCGLARKCLPRGRDRPTPRRPRRRRVPRLPGRKISRESTVS